MNKRIRKSKIRALSVPNTIAIGCRHFVKTPNFHEAVRAQNHSHFPKPSQQRARGSKKGGQEGAKCTIKGVGGQRQPVNGVKGVGGAELEG